jgi:UDP:flavonoid glycosyltransferase YjiC (YdhE family)
MCPVRVLFTTTGHSGHLLPLVPLARACRRAGHEVTVVVHGARLDAVERVGLPGRAVTEAPDEAWRPLIARAGALPRSQADAVAIGEGFAGIGGGSVLDEVSEVVEELRPDVLVHEGYEVAGPIAAERHGVPIVRMALGLASTEAWQAELAAGAVAALRARAGLPRAAAAGPPPTLLSLVPPSLDDGPAHRFREPLPSPAAAAAPPSGSEPPLVYVTLGSVTGSLPFFPGLFRDVLEALAPLPIRVQMTIGRDADPAALGPVPANARVEPWIDQEAVLASASVVVGHGGFGTTLGALAHGRPCVLLPLFAGDQWLTAARVAEVGAGVVLEDGERPVFAPPGPEVLTRLPAAVERALGDRGLRRAAERIGAEIAALPTADEAVTVLELVRSSPPVA